MCWEGWGVSYLTLGIQHPSQGTAQPPSNSVSSVRAFQSQKPENKLAVTSGQGEAGRGRMRKERKRTSYREQWRSCTCVLHNAGDGAGALQ